MYNVICEQCGKMFQSKTGKAHFCPDCIKIQLSERAKARKLNEIGGRAYAEKCKELREAKGH